MSRLVVFVETSQNLPAILFFTAIAYKQTRIVAINETQTRISCLQARSKILCAVDYVFNLLCAFICLQPMKKFVFSVASRATKEPLVGYKLSRVTWLWGREWARVCSSLFGNTHVRPLKKSKIHKYQNQNRKM